MTKLHKTYRISKDEIVEIWSNPGAAPVFFVNGVVQHEYTSKWKSWFAWRPVRTVSGHLIWGKMIYQRYKLTNIRFEESISEMISDQVYQYATDFDLLK